MVAQAPINPSQAVPSSQEPLTEAEINQLAQSSSPEVRRLAVELLHARWGFRTVRKLLVVYDPDRVKRAWWMTYELNGERP